MTARDWMNEAAAESLEVLSPGLRSKFKKKEWRHFERQLIPNYGRLLRLLHSLYGWRYDFAWILERMVSAAAEGYLARPRDLRRRDRLHREAPQGWVDEHRTVWAFSKIEQSERTNDLATVAARALGVTHLHLLADPASPELLSQIAHQLAAHDISMVLDFNRDPVLAPLDGHHPHDLTALCGEMLDLANLGAAAIRIDGRLFLRTPPSDWRNDSDIHLMIQVLRVVADISAPTLELVFDPGAGDLDSTSFVNPEECRLGVDHRLNRALWEALATADTGSLRAALTDRPFLSQGCAWLSYLPTSRDAFETVAARTGLEAAVEAMDPRAIDLAVRRTLALFSVILGVGGIPAFPLAVGVNTLSEGASQGVLRLLEVRRSLPGLRPSVSPQLLDPGDRSVLAFYRGPLLVVVNLSDRPAVLDRTGLGVDQFADLISGDVWSGHILGPYEFRWLTP